MSDSRGFVCVCVRRGKCIAQWKTNFTHCAFLKTMWCGTINSEDVIEICASIEVGFFAHFWMFFLWRRAFLLKMWIYLGRRCVERSMLAVVLNSSLWTTYRCLVEGQVLDLCKWGVDAKTAPLMKPLAKALEWTYPRPWDGKHAWFGHSSKLGLCFCSCSIPGAGWLNLYRNLPTNTP